MDSSFKHDMEMGSGSAVRVSTAGSFISVSLFSRCYRKYLGQSTARRSVNIGGWFVLEPFIAPALFQRYAGAGAIDEWTISTLMAADTANGGLNQLEQHYDTFIVRRAIFELA